MLRNRLALVISLLALLLQVAAGAQQTYLLTDIGPAVENFGANLQLAINASGQIAGGSEDGMAFVWKPSSPNASTGTFSLLPVPSGTSSSYAEGINSSGQIVGGRQYPSGTKKVKGQTVVLYTNVAVLWQANGSEVDLPSSIGVASAINDSGEIVGGTSLFVNGKAYPLPGVHARSINNSGQVAGIYDGNGNGYLWTPSVPNGTSGTYVTFPFFGSQVNSLGQVAGNPWNIVNPGVAAVFSISTGVQYLVPPPLNGIGGANAINNLGQVVGFLPSNEPFLWDSVHGVRFLNDTTQFTILNGSGWSLLFVLGINDYGQIVGWGNNPSGVQRTFLLTPQ